MLAPTNSKPALNHACLVCLAVREVGDGNINFVYILEGPAGALCLKQALPYVRVVGEDWPLTQVGRGGGVGGWQGRVGLVSKAGQSQARWGGEGATAGAERAAWPGRGLPVPRGLPSCAPTDGLHADILGDAL